MHKRRFALLFKAALAASCLSACHLRAADSADSSEWILDAETGVRIWNPAPAEEETVQWMGAKEAATGFGVVIWKVAGEESEQASGEWSGGRLDGYAVWKHRSGVKYEGRWWNGRRHGTGVYSWPDGTRFCGEYEEGIRREGALFSGDGSPVNGVPPDAIRKLVLDAEAAALQARKTATKARRQSARRKTTEITQSTQSATAQSEP